MNRVLALIGAVTTLILSSCSEHDLQGGRIESVIDDVRSGVYDNLEIYTISESVMAPPLTNLTPEAVKSFYSAKYVLRADLNHNQQVVAFLGDLSYSGKTALKDIDCFWVITLSGPRGAMIEIYIDRNMRDGFCNGERINADKNFKSDLFKVAESLSGTIDLE